MISGTDDVAEIKQRVSDVKREPGCDRRVEIKGKLGDDCQFVAFVFTDIRALSQNAAGKPFQESGFHDVAVTIYRNRLLIVANGHARDQFSCEPAPRALVEHAELEAVKLVVGLKTIFDLK